MLPWLSKIILIELTIKNMKALLSAIVLNVLLPFCSFSNPDVTSIPFQLHGKLVIVEAEVNGKRPFHPRYGVSEIILNNQYFNGSTEANSME